jgi:hypothetical protein
MKKIKTKQKNIYKPPVKIKNKKKDEKEAEGKIKKQNKKLTLREMNSHNCNDVHKQVYLKKF